MVPQIWLILCRACTLRDPQKELQILMTLTTGTVGFQQNGFLAGYNRSLVLGMCTDGVNPFVCRL